VKHRSSYTNLLTQMTGLARTRFLHPNRDGTLWDCETEADTCIVRRPRRAALPALSNRPFALP
jgi:hypothetical protein